MQERDALSFLCNYLFLLLSFVLLSSVFYLLGLFWKEGLWGGWGWGVQTTYHPQRSVHLSQELAKG